MNCSQFGEVVHDVDRGDALDEPFWAEALGHADECASCALFLDQVRMLNAGLRELANKDRAAQAPPRLETALRTIFRQRAAMNVHMRSWRRWIWAGAAAAVVVTAVTLLTLRHDIKPAAPAVAHSPEHTNSPAIQPATPAQPKEQVRTDPRQEARNTREPAPDSDAESLGEFVPLPDSLPLLPAEEASVVRVRLRRGSLSALGLLVNEERAADLIQVDFLVAGDGTPRAVRYVR